MTGQDMTGQDRNPLYPHTPSRLVVKHRLSLPWAGCIIFDGLLPTLVVPRVSVPRVEFILFLFFILRDLIGLCF